MTDVSTTPKSPVPLDAPEATDPDAARRLFRYVTAEEWRDYRAIVAVFAGTFFAEFTPDDVAQLLGRAGTDLDVLMVSNRLEQLRVWGNLTVSSSVGSPSSLADYYKRRNRYLITRAGQEVHGLVEGVLSRIDEVRDVSAGRLRSLRDAVVALDGLDIDTADPVQLADAVRAVFDPHEAFTDEVTQFFAAINQWQARYDLTTDEFRFFAEVLVGYVGDRLDEIERMARPIGAHLVSLEPKVPSIVARMAGGLATRVEEAGLAGTVSVTHQRGSTPSDWDHLRTWFRSTDAAPSRMDRLGREAVAAIRTLTLNLTRLGRVGVGASSRRGDFLSLARFFGGAPNLDACHHLAAAAFGLFPPNHLGTVADDADDPAATSTSWWNGPRASVAISLRERGDTTNRGATTPLRDRRAEAMIIRRRREAELAARAQVDTELLEIGDMDGATLSHEGIARLQQLLARTTHRRPDADGTRSVDDQAISCLVRHRPGQSTVLRTPAGELTLFDIRVRIEPAGQTATAHGH